MNPIDEVRVAANWRAITAELDVPRPSALERALRRCGTPGHIIRLVAATPALRRSWYLAVAGAVVLGLAAAKPGEESSLLTLLVLAPTLPVLGVALAFGPHSDPAYEAHTATPTRGAKLLFLRALTVLITSFVAVGVPTAFSVEHAGAAAQWLMPASALTTLAVALTTWLPPRRAAASAAVAWIVCVIAVQAITDDALDTFGPAGQLTALAVMVAAATVFTLRRSVLDRAVFVA